VVNAGGVNVEGCRDAVLKVAEAAKVNLKVGVVMGDDLTPQVPELAKTTKEMFSGAKFPTNPLSCNAYLGAFPIAQALAAGCDVVITGRVVDSALVLGPLIHEFGWTPKDLDQLSAGTLAGHLVECGAQGTGGLFTDWHTVPGWIEMGFPVVAVGKDGGFTISKPPGTGGLVTPATVAEQMLYEIQDPGAYHVPDVACDWTQVTMTQEAPDVVRVAGARGLPPTDTYKCIATHLSGHKLMVVGSVIGHRARDKANRVAQTLLARWRKMLEAGGHPEFSESRVELLGGDFEVTLRLGVKHPNQKALAPLVRESATASVSMAQGGLIGPGTLSPVISGYCFLMPKSVVTPVVDVGAGLVACEVEVAGGFTLSASTSVKPVSAETPAGPTVTLPLRELCYARSGDKGSAANIGLIARRPEYLPVLRHAVTAERVKAFFRPDCKGMVERFDLPGISGMNFLLHDTLGGGGTSSLHLDALAKAYGQRLLEMRVDVPAAWGWGQAKL